MWCEPITSPHPSCRTLDVEENCKKALNSNDIKNAILGCNFTQARNSPPFVQIAEGGVLINQATTLSSGSTLISNPLPLVIYSPDAVTLTLQGEEFLIIPPKKIEALSIIDSALSPGDLILLKNTHFWGGIWEDMDGEDYFNISLGGLQVLLLPLTIWGIICALKQRKKTSRSNRYGWGTV